MHKPKVAVSVTPAHPLRAKMQERFSLGDTFSIAAPSLTELIFGISLLPRAAKNLQEWEHIRESFGYYGVGRIEAELAALLQIELRRRGRQLDTVDALIATTALRNDLVLLTTDGDFAPISDLKQENWIAKANASPI